jgi:tetratricopeptide (TPR) repeat protein
MNIVFDMKPQTTLCLNMIVKNESRVITRLLESVSDIIDSYCICDTGSTDNTVEIIESYFKAKGIPGKIIYEPFKDFGHNRTFALQACENLPNADYILLLDADMIFWLNPSITPSEFKNALQHDAYTIFQGGESFYYKNTRIVRNYRGCKYWGVTHEYVQLPNGSSNGTIEKSRAFINDIGDGGSKTNKFERDVKLLEQGLVDNPNNDRYTFYLANSYNDLGNYEKAIENYRKRIKLGGWHEEVWFSYYKIGMCYKYMGKMENAIYEWLQAYDVFPNRIENLYEIVKYYRCEGKNKLAFVYYELADKMRKKYPETDYLFLQKDVYDYKLDYEFSIIAYYLDSHGKNIPKECMKLCAHPYIDDSLLRNTMTNYKFYTPSYMSMCKSNHNCEILKDIANQYTPEGFSSTTPSICKLANGDVALIIRYVNYTIDENGNYKNKEVIQTINYLAILDTTQAEWSIKTIEELKYNKTHDSLYAGLEDVRIVEYKNTLLYNANRGLGYHNMKIEHGKIISHETYEDVILKKEGERQVEKNWVLFESNEQLYCIYEWYPLTIGTIENDTYNTKHEFSMPSFFKHVRGSTNGQLYLNERGEKEIWFLCHTVSYENRRFYYHLFVCLDAESMQLKKYTPWFTFEKKPVEYSLGFVFFEKDIVIGYSTMDSDTKFMSIEKRRIDEDMIIFG